MKPKYALRKFLLGSITLAITSSANAAIVFSDDFETPDVTAAQSDGNTSGAIDATKWVKANFGFGSGSQGTADEAHGDFTEVGAGEQAYAFRYTNSGITTTFGSIGALSLGTTYTINFDAVLDGHSPGTTGTPYDMGLVTFDGAGTRTSQTSFSNNTSSVLATAAGDATTDGLYTPVSFTFTADAKTDYAVLFQDLALRFKGATTSAIIDNVQVSSADVAPTLYWNSGTGTWDGSTTTWNTAADDSGTSEAWGALDRQAFFNTTGDYTVTVDGSQDASLVVFQNGGTVTLADGTSGAINLTANTPIQVQSGMTVNAAVPITEDAAGRELIKVGAGTLSLSGDNTYTGLTTVVGGKLILSGNNVAATGGMALNEGVTQFESAASINGTARDVTVNANGTVVFGAAFGAANIPAALLNRVVASSTGVIAADNYTATDFDFSTAGLSAAFLGATSNLSYTGTLTPQGTTYRLGGGGGTLTMANANALTGGNSVVVQGGVVLAASNDFTGGLTVNSGATLVLGASQNFTGGLTVNSGASLTTGSTQAYAGGLTLNGGTVRVSAGTYTGFGTGDLTINTGSTIIGVNTGTFTSSNNSFMAGTISLNRNVTGVTTWNHDGDITLTSNVTLNSASNGWNTVVNGSIGQTGNRSLTISGNVNSIELNAANTFSGGLTYSSGGTLRINNASALGTGTFTISSGSIDNTSGAAITLSTNNAQNWNNNITFTGSNDLNLGTGAVTMNNNRNVTVNGGTLTVGGAIGESGGNRNLTKLGVGTLILNGANTYTGTTAVNEGSLIINGNSSTATGNVTVGVNGTLGGSGTVGGDTTVSGNLRPGTSPGVLAFSGDLTLLAAATTTMEILDEARGTQYDGIDVVEGLAYAGTLSLDFVNTFAAGSYTFNLFDFDTETGSFDTVTLAGVYSGSLIDDGFGVWSLDNGTESWSFTQSTGDLGLTVIPEPSAALLGAIGFLVLLRRRR